MKIFGWNTRGLQSPRSFNALLIRKQESKVELMFLMETRSNQSKMELLRVKLGYVGKITVDSVGNSGGLCLLWDSSIDMALVSFFVGHIDVSIRKHTTNYRD
ncbi:hypothetical protein Ddye_029091 [Dipteronia dyeriana]|uniref:Uncharacterized protein n=1 Tax=Dipteronia dyeriana TaxID=168575 RepID=A0AAD9TDT4_9ROSI|nr:hypothetical protein Ddye_029091 [Dipteronia dyeriana]